MSRYDIEYYFYGDNKRAIECRDPEVVLAGPRDTGKTLALLWKLHRIALKYKKVSIVIVRKRQTDTYSTVLQTFTEKVLGDNAAISTYGGEKAQWFTYPDNARIWVAGMDKSSKVLSAQHDIIYVNQAEELTLAEWEHLTSTTTGRAGHMPYSQTIGDCNPATPTHWIKQRAKTGSLTLFESTHQDNPELYDQSTGEITEAGVLRLGNLKRLTGSRLLRLYRGLWAFPEGAIYSMFDEERHKVEAFPVPDIWGRAVGIDPFGAEIAAVWVAFDSQAQVLNVYREYVEPFGLTTAEHAKKIRDKSAHEWISAWAGGGPSERAWRLEWEAAGIPLLEPPIGDVWVGIDRIIDLLNDFKLVIHDCCGNLLSEVGSYRRKLKNGVVTEQIENDTSYHLLQALRYIIVLITQPGSGMEIVYQPKRIGVGL